MVLLLLGGLGGCAGAPSTGTEPEELYDPARVRALGLTISDGAWSALLADPFTFVEASLQADERTLIVGVRLKGNSTFSPLDAKPSLIVDVAEWVPGQTLLGEERFNLHNGILDPSRMSETLTYARLRAADLPASRTGFVRLAVNGADYGLYTSVEPIRDGLLARWFDDPDGNLYEAGDQSCDLDDPSCFEREETDEGSDTMLFALSADASLVGDAWLEAMHQQLDWDRFVRGLAMDALLAHWDGYAFDRSNYHLYHEPTSNRWSFVPQSTDLDYGWRPFDDPDPRCGEYGVDPGEYTEGLLAAKCLADAECRAEFEDALLELAGDWEASDPAAAIDTLDAIIGGEIASDTRAIYDEDAYVAQTACLRAWVTGRPEWVESWVRDSASSP